MIENQKNKIQLPPGPLVTLGTPFVDDRGVIQPLVGHSMASSQMIISKPGALRANHYHKEDWHYCFMVSGSMNYYHRAVGAEERPESLLIKEGQMIFTPPMWEHAMEFLEDSVFINFAGLPRDQVSYEDDLVRIELIKPKPQE